MRLQDATIRVLDFETTGLDPEAEKVCEVGYCNVRYDSTGRNGQWVTLNQPTDHLINPGIPMPAVASAVHHLTDRDFVDVSSEEHILPSVFEDYDLYAAHNAEFDSAFAGEYSGESPWLCTMRLAKHLLPNMPSYKNQVLRYELGYIDVLGDPHRAGHDAMVTALILCHMLNLIDTKKETVESIVALAESPVFLTGTMGFGKNGKLTWKECGVKDRGYLQWMAKQGEQGPTNPDGWDRDQWYTLKLILGGGPLP